MSVSKALNGWNSTDGARCRHDVLVVEVGCRVQRNVHIAEGGNIEAHIAKGFIAVTLARGATQTRQQNVVAAHRRTPGRRWSRRK